MKNDDAQFEDEQPGRAVSIIELARIISRYRQAILLIVGSVLTLFVIGSIITILLLPSRRVTTLPFRLEFTGADRGQYPNGTKFSTSEIVSTPVLLEVYNGSGLKGLVDYPSFKNSIFVTEENPGLEALEREYRAKLADPKLLPVDRQRLEQEFQEKKASIARSEYAIVWIESGRVRQTPGTLKVQVLTQILDAWARQTIQNKGVVLYDLPILSSGIFEPKLLDSYDYIIALDVLRAKIGRVVRNIDQLSEIPGAEVVRSDPPSRASLAELRVRLDDALKFKIEPLVGSILDGGLSKNAPSSIAFLRTRLTFNDMATKEADARVKTLHDSLLAYQQISTPRSSAPGSEPPSQTVIPQIDESFLDRLVTLTSENNDLEFRQQLINDIRMEAMKGVPLRTESQYYQTLIQSLRGFETRARVARPDEFAAMQKQVNDVVNEAVRTTEEVNQIYRAISQNLNPSTVLYSATAPATSVVERSISLSRLALAGLLLLMLTLPIAIVGSLLHHRLYGRMDEPVSEDDDEHRNGSKRVTTPGERRIAG